MLKWGVKFGYTAHFGWFHAVNTPDTNTEVEPMIQENQQVTVND